MKISNSIAHFKKYLQATGKSPNTIKSYLHDLKLFTDYLIENKLEDINKIDTSAILDYFETRKVTNNTKNRLLYSMKQFFGCLVLKDLIKINPTTDIKRFKGEMKSQITLTEDNITMLRGIVKNLPKWHAITELMLSLPLRVSEVCNLKKEDVFLNEDKIIIMSSKNKEYRELPLLEEVGKILRQYVKYKEKQAKKLKWDNPSDYFFVGQLGKKLSPRSIRYNLKQFYKKAKINPQASSHTLRHTVCTVYGLKGIDAFKLAALAGHKNLSTTQRYVNITLKDKKEALQNMKI